MPLDGCLEPLKAFRVEGLMHVKSVEVQSLAVGGMWELERFGVSAQVSFSPLDHGSKLRVTFSSPGATEGPFCRRANVRLIRVAVAQWLRYRILAGISSTTKDPPCRAAMQVESVES
ncbi:hypothetical protein TNCV_164611 [Trichonephila clavipes]|nr:hypothetical protein TNCV_164611 [Trichonephila clavipes]